MLKRFGTQKDEWSLQICCFWRRTRRSVDSRYGKKKSKKFKKGWDFSNFSCMFLNPNNFSNLNSYCSNLSYLRNFQEQVKNAFCYQKLSWPFTVLINCSSDLKYFANSRPSASNFKSFSRSLEQFFLTVGQNNFGNKIPFLHTMRMVRTTTVISSIFP